MAEWRTDYSQYRRYFFDIVSLYKRRQDLKAFLEILLSIGTITLFVGLAIRPTVVTISQLLTEIKNKEETIAQMDTKIKNLQIAQSLLTQNVNQIALLETAVPAKPIPEQELRQIEGLAKKSGVSILTLGSGEVALIGEASAAKVAAELKALPEKGKYFTITGSFTGDFSSLLSFLKDLENLRRPIYLDKTTFTSVVTATARQIVLSISGRVVYL